VRAMAGLPVKRCSGARCFSIAARQATLLRKYVAESFQTAVADCLASRQSGMRLPNVALNLRVAWTLAGCTGTSDVTLPVLLSPGKRITQSMEQAKICPALSGYHLAISAQPCVARRPQSRNICRDLRARDNDLPHQVDGCHYRRPSV
jgi:hypothetical protein